MEQIIASLAMSPYMFRWGKPEQDGRRLELIRRSFQHHFANNAVYRRMCDESGFTPEEIRSHEDLMRVPMVPASRFKAPDSHLLLSIPLADIEFEMRSTGTGGIPSVSRRDHHTCNAAGAILIALYRDFFSISKGVGLYLCPSPAEMPEMGMVKALNILNVAFDAHCFGVEGMRFNAKKSVDFLNQWDGSFTRYILGPPFLLNSLCDYLDKHDMRLKLDPESKIITIGGWKRFTGRQIPREQLDEKCREYLGVESGQIRDMYGLVETNQLAIECEYHVKHVPVTVSMTARNSCDTSKEVPDGKPGLIAILDPSSRSYPGFILTEDVGIVRRDVVCECGRRSDIVKIVGRAPKSEIGCCAVSLEKHITERDAADVIEQPVS